MDPCQYFIAKVASIPALQRCAETSLWACRDRLNPPHPRTVLSEAFKKSTVILIFSVNNCHGWHGYAEMVGPPNSVGTHKSGGKETHCFGTEQAVERGVTESGDKVLNARLKPDETDCEVNSVNKPETAENDLNNLDDIWYHFPVKWKVCFIKEFGEQCLSSKLTENLKVSDTLFLNKARNWQEVSLDVGQTVCSLIDEFYASLCEKKMLQQQKLLEKQPDAFFEDKQSVATVEETWNKIVAKIEVELGQVILACPFGSQRY